MPKRRQNPRSARLRTRRMDEILSETSIPPRPNQGWVRTIRSALGMSQQQLGSRLGVTRQRVGELETQEGDDRVTLSTLRRTAGALGCELEYVFVPRTSLDQAISEQAFNRAKQRIERVNASQALEASAISSTSLGMAISDLTNELATKRPADLWDD
jgi:predicted DNA-binding mobile mystery protein A